MSVQNGEPRPPDEQIKDQEEIQAHSASTNESVRRAAEDVVERRDNFLEKLGNPQVDSDGFENLSQVLGPDLSISHILAAKDDDDLQRDLWLTENEIERLLHEHNPGRICSEHPDIAALMQGVHDKPDKARLLDLTAEERRKIREAGRVKYSRHTLGTGEGMDAVSKIQTVNEINRGGSRDEEESSGRVRGAIGRVFG